MTGSTFISGKVVLLLSPSYLKALSENLKSHRLPLEEEAAGRIEVVVRDRRGTRSWDR